MEPNPQAVELNETIEKVNPHVAALLSQKGRSAFFPSKGILAQTAAAKKKRINATIGMAFEDDSSLMHLPALGSKISLSARDAFSYAPSFGKPELRRTWLEMIRRKNPSLNNTSLSTPVVTNALTHGLCVCGSLFVDPGDRIVVPDLFWGNYKLIFQQGFDAELATFQTFDNNGFNLEGFRRALQQGNSKKVVCILNFPNNPSGYTPTAQEAAQLTHILVETAEAGTSIAVLCDDAYFGLAYEDDIITESFFAGIADAHERICAVKVDGPTKEDYVWGFRVGFLTFGTKRCSDEMYEALQAKCAGLVRGSISNASHLSQSLLLAAYRDPEYCAQKQEKFHTLKSRYARVKKILSDHPEYTEAFSALPFNSGYFMCVRLKNADAHTVRQRLLDKYDTGVIAVGSLIRIAYASCPAELLDELFHNLYRACTDTD